MIKQGKPRKVREIFEGQVYQPTRERFAYVHAPRRLYLDNLGCVIDLTNSHFHDGDVVEVRVTLLKRKRHRVYPANVCMHDKQIGKCKYGCWQPAIFNAAIVGWRGRGKGSE